MPSIQNIQSKMANLSELNIALTVDLEFSSLFTVTECPVVDVVTPILRKKKNDYSIVEIEPSFTMT